MRILVTGGAGFIGSNLVRYLIEEEKHTVINVDKLTYAGNLHSLEKVSKSPLHIFEQVDICDAASLAEVFRKHLPQAVMHLAAESHVDRSIDSPGNFISTNIVGTFNLLQIATHYWHENLNSDSKFRFHHISTDEVFGSLGETGKFTEETPYSPRSPYSASKAGSDHLVAAWHHTYGLPTVTSNCSNNYGPYQFPEKLIPHIILNALKGDKLPVYGNGLNIRDWLYVEDHVRALYKILTQGRIGRHYLIGGDCERTNLNVVESICDILDKQIPNATYVPHRSLITFVKDRPGHDFRYAIDASKTRDEIGWRPQETFETGIQKTINWYLQNETWWRGILDNSYKLGRLGLK